MKKIGKLLIICMLVCGFVLTVAGCNDDKPFVPPEPDGSKVNINDAYDWNEDKNGSNRPELGGGYKPTLPPTAAVITLAEGSSIKFKGGATTLTLPLGNVLKTEDFDESTLGGHKIGGVGVINEEKKINNYVSLSDFTPTSNATVQPYFAPEHGEPFVYGTKDVGDYFYDGDGTDIAKNKLTTEYKLVDGYMGRSITYAEALKENAYFRCVTVCERESGQNYSYFYRFANFGENELSFTVYQMSGGHAWADPEMSVSTEPITLAAGASTTVTINVENNTKNDANSLTLIRFNKEITGMALGVSMEVKNTTPVAPATITLDLPEGFVVSDDYAKNVNTNDKIKLPTVAQIKNTTGHNLMHWAYADDKKVVEGERIKGDITIKPVLSEDAAITLELPAGLTVADEFVKNYQTGDKIKLPTAEQITNTTGHNVLGWTYGDGTEIKNNAVIKGNITIKPVLSEDATITLELPDKFTVSAEYKTNVQTKDKLVLPTVEQITNETGKELVRWLDSEDKPVKNGQTVTGNITIKPELTQPVTIAVKLPEGLTLAEDFEKTSWTGRTIVTPTAKQISGTIADGRKIEGWYNMADNSVITDKSTYIETEITLAPYFSRRDGTAVLCNFGDNKIDGKPLVFNNVQSSNKPMNVYKVNDTSTISTDSFNAITDNNTAISGANGYAELGNVLSYNGKMLKGDAFRCGTKVSNTPIVKLNVEHTFYYNFENLGTEKISLTVQGVNSGTSVEGTPTDVVLLPGESTVVSFKVTYTKGDPNKNVMAFFTVKEEMTDMKLGVSVNVALAKESASITLKSGIEGFKLNDAYLNKEVKTWEKLVLPTAADYTDEQSESRKVIGWKDANERALANGMIISSNIELVPVFDTDAKA